MSTSQGRRAVSKLLLSLISMCLGAAVAFPGAIGWYFEWHSSPGQNFPPGLVYMVLVGAGGGLLWSMAREHRHKWLLRAFAATLVLSPYVGLVLYAAYAFARDWPSV